MKYNDMITMVFEAEGLDPSDLSALAPLPLARSICFKLARTHTKLTFAEIGMPFKKSKPAVLQAVRILDGLISTDKRLAEKYQKYEIRVIDMIELSKTGIVYRPYKPGLLFRYRKIRLSPK